MVKRTGTDLGIEKALKEKVKGQKKLEDTLNLLLENRYIRGLQDEANKVAIVRMGYNDHGPVHGRIAAYNALRIYDLLGLKGSVVVEEMGDEEDSKVCILMAAFLHDTGISLAREGHELFGTIVTRPIVEDILRKVYKDEYKIARMASLVSEGILCHMGTYQATSLEARIVETADGTDVTKGRARIPFHIGEADIHKFSALAIEKVNISKGVKKPVRIEIEMDNPAGIFQAEEIMLKKTKDARMEEYIEIVAYLKGQKKPIVIL